MKVLPRLKIRPSTVVFLVLLALFDQSRMVLIPLLAAALHELGHIAAMLILRVPIREIEFTIVGAEIRSDFKESGLCRSLAVYGSGAAVNLICVAALCLLPAPLQALTEVRFFALSSLSLGAVNLLPIESLDGGCILRAVLRTLTPRHMPILTDIISAITLGGLWLFSVYLLLLTEGNLSLMLFCFYLFVTLFVR